MAPLCDDRGGRGAEEEDAGAVGGGSGEVLKDVAFDVLLKSSFDTVGR
jgi:hypothetical protein